MDVHVDFDKKQHEMLQPSKCDITVGEILRAAGGIGATMKLARRRLPARVHAIDPCWIGVVPAREPG